MTNNKGIKLAFATAIVSGVAIFINKFAVGAITPPLVFTTTKNTLVAILILSLLVFNGKWKKIHALNRGELIKLSLIGIIGGALPFYLFFTGLSQIPAINAALIHKSLVLWIIILAIPFLKEKLSPLQVFAIIILFSSNLIIGGFKGFAWSTGELMVLGATLFWAIENIVAKKTLKTVDPDLVVTARMGIGSIILLSLSIWKYPVAVGAIHELSLQSILWMLATAVTLLLYVSTWYRALKFAPAITVATVLVSSTIVTNLLSAIFITHVWNTKILIQAGIILLGLAIFIKSEYSISQKQVLT